VPCGGDAQHGWITAVGSRVMTRIALAAMAASFRAGILDMNVKLCAEFFSLTEG
jgi:hypothetical protein